MITRREWIRTSVGAVAITLIGRRALFGQVLPPPVVTVYKRADCECCGRWVKHMSTSGFVVTVREVADVSEIKRTMGVPAALASCHTALVGPYVIEGHVPADLVKKVLRDKPPILGLAAPGMPVGSPGMEGGAKQPYDIIAFERSGQRRVYAHR
jgi:hypothetical protein